MAAARGRGRGRGRGGPGLLPTITWPGSFGPTEYEAPLEQFPLEGRPLFRPPRYLRPYDERKDEWPLCHHGEPCVVQMFDGYIDGGRRFFRCPNGLSFLDEGNCRYAKWVDPPIEEHNQEYMHYLMHKIFDLEQRVHSLEAEVEANPWVISIEGDPLCPDPWCKCPYHLKKDRPPSPPSSGGAGYYEAGPSQFSQSQYY